MDSVVIFASIDFRNSLTRTALSPRTALCSHTHHALHKLSPRTAQALTTHCSSSHHALLSALTRTSSHCSLLSHAQALTHALLCSRLDAATRTQLRSAHERSSDPLHTGNETTRTQLRSTRTQLRSAHERSSDPLTPRPTLRSTPLQSTPIRIRPTLRSTPIQAPIQSTLTVSFLNTFLTPTSFFSDPFSIFIFTPTHCHA